MTHRGAATGPLEAGGQIVRLVNVITRNQLVKPGKIKLYVTITNIIISITTHFDILTK